MAPDYRGMTAARIIANGIEATRAAIPPDAVAAGALQLPERTERWLFARLAPLGHAWRLPDGTKVFDPRHPRVAARLAARGGVVDEALEAESPARKARALGWARLIESVERFVARQGSSREGVVGLVRRGLEEMAPAVLGDVPGYSTYMCRRRKYLASGRLASALLDGRGRKKGPGGMSAEAWELFKRLYLTEQQRSARHCYRLVMEEAERQGWAWPSYRSVARRVNEELPPPIRDRARLGERRWNQIHLPKIVRDTGQLRGNEHWEVDHLRLDFFVREGRRTVRPWATVCVDRASNLITGWAVGMNPSSDTIAIALRRGIRQYGAPLHLTMDRGLDMTSRAILRFCEDVGIEVHLCRGHSPWQKGAVESKAKTIHLHFCTSFDSYCGGSPRTKPQEIAQRCRQNAAVCPTREEVERRFREFVAADADRPSDAQHMKGEKPRERFEATRIAFRTVPERALNVLLLPMGGPRRVTAKGVLWDGLFYTDDAGRTFEQQGKMVCVRYDADDIGYIWVCDMNGAPLYKARQNYVAGTREDVRRACAAQARARRIVREATAQGVVALDDAITRVLRVQAAAARRPAAEAGPPADPGAANRSPIRTPVVEAIVAADGTIGKEETRDRARGLCGQAAPTAGFTPSEMQALIGDGGEHGRPKQDAGPSMIDEFLAVALGDVGDEDASDADRSSEFWNGATDGEATLQAG